jgi:hypothetical protein
MSETIPPALSETEWATLGPNGSGHPIMPSCVADLEYLDPRDSAKAIAVANANYPDDDPRKITWAMVDQLRVCAEEFETSSKSHTCYRGLRRLADILASYLPPR